MKRRQWAPPGWWHSRIARAGVGIGLLALLVTAVFTAGAFLTHASSGHTNASHKLTAQKDNPRAEGEWFQLSHFGNKPVSPNARSLAYQQAARLPHSTLGTARAGATSNTSGPLQGAWYPLGPQPLNSYSNPNFDNWNYGTTSGRLTAVAVDPANASIIYVGAADGGVWKSSDGGKTWASVSDTWTTTLSVGSITIDPTNPNTVYVGTGEANANGDAFWGSGVMKTTDGGQTWTNYGFSQFGGLAIGKLAIDPNNHLVLLASVDYDGATTPPGASPTYVTQLGIWRSSDGGQTWTQELTNATNSALHGFDTGTDVIFDPANMSVAYAGLADRFGIANNSTYTSQAGIYKSTNDGVSWTLLGSGAPSGVNVERVSLGISNSANHIYAVVTNPADDLLNSDIYTSANGGSTWGTIDVSGVPGMASDDGENQWWYDSYAAVDPTDTTGNTLYVGGVDIWQTTNGGTSWTNLTNAYSPTPAGPHPDQHALAFLPGSSSYIVGNDGGVWSGTNTGTFTNLNTGGLNITQFYGGSVGEQGTNAQLYGGAQDNGEDQYIGNPSQHAVGAWNEAVGGDGGQTAVDYTNNANVYQEYADLNINKSTDGGQTWVQATLGINTSDAVNFIAPLVMSPNTPSVLYAGTDRVYRTTNSAGGWSPISPVFDTNPITFAGVPVSAIAVAASDENFIYAGDNDGHVYSTSDGGGSWSVKTTSNFLCASGMVTSVAADPTNPNVAYATCAGFAAGSGGHVYMTANGGATWTDISAGLPNIPAESVAVSPSNHNLVVVGTDAGIFATTNTSVGASATWSTLGNGLPNAAVDSIFFNHTGTELYVATHGRGMWQMLSPQIATVEGYVATATTPSTIAPSQKFTLKNTGVGSLNYTISGLPSWVASVSPASGTVAQGGFQPITVNYAVAPSSPQTLDGTLTITDPAAFNSGYTLPLTEVVANVSKTWYFAEGYTGGSFTEYLTLANPGSTAANVSVEYLLGGGQTPITKPYVVGATSRRTLTINQEVGSGQNVSLVVTSDQPIVAERPMYFTYTGLPGYTIPGGSDVLGATSLGTSYDFGYLDTTAGHATYLTILNPNSSAMTVTTTYYTESTGAATQTIHTVAANSRGTINVNSEAGLPAGPYSATVTLSEPGLVERPLYLRDSGTGDTGSADVIGVSQPLTSWSFAEGYTGSTFSERYILSNLSTTTTAHATVTFFKSDGSTVQQAVALPPGTQRIVNANQALGTNVENSASVTSDLPILAERFMSFKYTGPVGPPGTSNPGIPGASDVLGAGAPSRLFDFAEGYTGGQFAEYLTIENPNPQPVTVQVTFLPQNSGSTPFVRHFTIGATSRFGFYINAAMVNQSFSMQVIASAPVVAERPMYFIYNGSQTGGSDIVGYQP